MQLTFWLMRGMAVTWSIICLFKRKGKGLFIQRTFTEHVELLGMEAIKGGPALKEPEGEGMGVGKSRSMHQCLVSDRLHKLLHG